ncbi:MAG: hypothetical protein NTV88_05100 [Candidatus Micrarchaeota archaeon]|nr:hypothetical protein [Candidatus Micrarchaeota archaeon]
MLAGKKLINPLNVLYIPNVNSHLVASKSVMNHFLKGAPLSEDEIKKELENYNRGTAHARRSLQNGKGGDYRVIIYSFAFNDFKAAAGRPDPEAYEKIIMSKDRGAMLTRIEQAVRPEKNHRMDKRPIEYNQKNSEMLFYLMDVAHEFVQDYSPAIATLDLGSRLESMPMLLGTDYYYMTYGDKKDEFFKLQQRYPQIIALQRFERKEAMAIAYNMAGVSVLMNIASSEPKMFLPEFEKALECFSCALEIKPDYPDAREGKAYALSQIGDEKQHKIEYDAANEIRKALEIDYRKFVEKYSQG